MPAMGALLASVYALHLLFGGLWAGAVMFYTYSLLPLAGDGLDAGALGDATGKLTTISRASAVIQLLTGGYLASPMGVGSAGYWSTTTGVLVVVMVVLWLFLAALTEMGAGRVRDAIEAGDVRAAGTNARGLLYGASVVAVLLLLEAGALAGGL